jgi:hypothetical protein
MGKFMMKTFSTKDDAIAYVNNPTKEIESIISMITNHTGMIDVTYIINDGKYAKYEIKCKEIIAKRIAYNTSRLEADQVEIQK